jgi:Protein of unknown function (DUF1232)
MLGVCVLAALAYGAANTGPLLANIRLAIGTPLLATHTWALGPAPDVAATVPDFIPVLGYADDAIIISLVLRSVLRSAGPDAVWRNWPGTNAGLVSLWRLCGLGVHGRSAF